MNKIAYALLERANPQLRHCVVDVVELGSVDASANAPGDTVRNCLVTLRQGPVLQGVLQVAGESTLTAAPVTRAAALARAQDFVKRRVAAGERLLAFEGLEGLDGLQVLAVAAPAARTVQVVPVTTDAPSASIAELVARFEPARWKLLAPPRKARTAWRLAERADSGVKNADQQALVKLAPRLIELLESGEDALDYCLAVALARLGDGGAGVAMQQLAGRGRSPATRRAAHQAWLVLQGPAAQSSHAGSLQIAWLTNLPAAEQFAALTQAAAAKRSSFVAALIDWYDCAICDAAAHAALCTFVKHAPLQAGVFQALRYTYKAAELRRDAPMLALLHGRFENTRSSLDTTSNSSQYAFRHPATGALVKRSVVKELARPDSVLAYTKHTRDYLRLRAWRNLRRLAAIEHSHAPELAKALLLALDDADLPAASQEQRWQYDGKRYGKVSRYYQPSARWLIVAKLLVAGLADKQQSARATRWWTPSELNVTHMTAKRVDGLQAVWNAQPQVLIELCLHSKCALVHAVMARALQDHLPLLSAAPAATLKGLLQSAYAPTARVAFLAIKAQLEQQNQAADQAPWLVLLAASSDPQAQDFALLMLAGNPAGFAQQTALVVSLLLSPVDRVRRQGAGLAQLANAEQLLPELVQALLAFDDTHLAQTERVMQDLQALLCGTLASAAAQFDIAELLDLLAHTAVPVVHLAVSWILLAEQGASRVPPTQFVALLNAAEPKRRAAGVRLLAALSVAVLATQQELLLALALHPHSSVRLAIEPALLKLAAIDSAFAERLAQQLHSALFMAEAKDDSESEANEPSARGHALALLTGALAAHAPARDAVGVWRALQAQSSGAQAYGEWALAALTPADFSYKQLATLCNHPAVSVRAWAIAALEGRFGSTGAVTLDQQHSAALLPLANSSFDDALAFAQALFSSRLSDDSLSIELLIAWIDHPKLWVQAAGRARLVRRMSAAEASMCLTQLSQHPSQSVQLFVTQWLLELPKDNPAALAARMAELKPYFFTVLSQVNRSRVAKNRVTSFLRDAMQSPEPAQIVADIFARQVVTSSLVDKPQYIAGLRDIAALHPTISLPFLERKITSNAHKP